VQCRQRFWFDALCLCMLILFGASSLKKRKLQHINLKFRCVFKQQKIELHFTIIIIPLLPDRHILVETRETRKLRTANRHVPLPSLPRRKEPGKPDHPEFRRMSWSPPSPPLIFSITAFFSADLPLYLCFKTVYEKLSDLPP